MLETQPQKCTLGSRTASEKHRTNMMNETEPSDVTMKKALTNGIYFYSHVCFPGIIRKATRVLEDIVMFCLKDGIHNQILANLQQGECRYSNNTRSEFKEFGILVQVNFIELKLICIEKALIVF